VPPQCREEPVKLELGRFKGGQSLTSRLSFRSKLLLVLFIPFLALVIVAAAGLSDRFASLHAQEQYGSLSAPLSSLDQASRALRNESVVSSWYVGSGGAPAAELTQARARTDVAVKEFRASGPGSTCRPRPQPTPAPSSWVSTSTSSTSASGSPVTSRAPTCPPASHASTRSSGPNTSRHGKRASTSRCSPAVPPRTSASGWARRLRNSSTSPASTTPRPPTSSRP
jgi:hypothetical protein